MIRAAAVAVLATGLLVSGAGTPVAPARAATGAFTLHSAHVDGAITVRTLTPAGWNGRTQLPVLYLLHGYGESSATWLERGDLEALAAGFPGLIVLPDQRGGFSVDHRNGGRFGAPAWSRLFYDDLVPAVEQRFPLRPGRRWRSIAGASMGGYGALVLAAQRPGWFGSAVSLSGIVDVQDDVIPALTTAQGTDYAQMLGPADGAYAEGHNPLRLLPNLAHTRTLALVGDGVAGAGSFEVGTDALADRVALLGLGTPIERYFRGQHEAFAAAGGPVRFGGGVHDWPDFRARFSQALRWGMFEPVQSAPWRWTFRTARQDGVAWDVAYRLAAPPTGIVELRRERDVLVGTGSGTITIATARCRFTTALPFRRRCSTRAARRHSAHRRTAARADMRPEALPVQSADRRGVEQSGGLPKEAA